MSPAQILQEVRRAPFEPFRMVLANGAVYNIRHPDQCMVLPKSVVVGEVSQTNDEFIEWTVTVNPYNVLRIEHEHELVGRGRGDCGLLAFNRPHAGAKLIIHLRQIFMVAVRDQRRTAA